METSNSDSSSIPQDGSGTESSATIPHDGGDAVMADAEGIGVGGGGAGGGEEAVPQFVDMYIPDYESNSSGEQNNNTAAQILQKEAAAKAQTKAHKQKIVGRPTEMDVVLNPDDVTEYPGNLRYKAVVRHLAKRYTKVKSGYRTAAVQILVNAVKAQGGRFLCHDKEGNWQVISEKKAFAKATQAMRGTSRKVKVVSTRGNRQKKKAKRSTTQSQSTAAAVAGEISAAEMTTSSTTSAVAARATAAAEGIPSRQLPRGATAVTKRNKSPSSSSSSSSSPHVRKVKQGRHSQSGMSGTEATNATTKVNVVDEQEQDQNRLDLVALRLQTQDFALLHVDLNLHSVDHNDLFPFAKALDSSKLLQSMSLHLAPVNRTNADAISWGLSRCKSLRQVKVVYGKIGKSEGRLILRGICQNLHIESINLDDNHLQSDDIKALCKLLLDTPKSSSSSKSSSKLQRLSLEENPFGDDGARYISELLDKHKQLRFLNLARNGMTMTGINAIQASIQRQKSTRLFEISGLQQATKEATLIHEYDVQQKQKQIEVQKQQEQKGLQQRRLRQHQYVMKHQQQQHQVVQYQENAMIYDSISEQDQQNVFTRRSSYVDGDRIYSDTINSGCPQKVLLAQNSSISTMNEDVENYEEKQGGNVDYGKDDEEQQQQQQQRFQMDSENPDLLPSLNDLDPNEWNDAASSTSNKDGRREEEEENSPGGGSSSSSSSSGSQTSNVSMNISSSSSENNDSKKGKRLKK